MRAPRAASVGGAEAGKTPAAHRRTRLAEHRMSWAGRWTRAPVGREWAGGWPWVSALFRGAAGRAPLTYAEAHVHPDHS